MKMCIIGGSAGARSASRGIRQLNNDIQIDLFTARTFAFYELFLTAAAIDLVLVYGVIWVFHKIEHRISAHLRAAPETVEPVA